MATQPFFILASASPRRLQLLAQAGLVPQTVIAADIDETPRKNELPDAYAARVAAEKATVIAAQHPGAVVLAADTVVACGRRILPKAETEAQARECLKRLSGRRHRVYTAVTTQKDQHVRHALVLTQVKCRRLSTADIEAYMATGQWQGKAGGYAIQGRAEAFIPWINGSYSNVVGLPIAETCQLLAQFGIRPVSESTASRQPSPEPRSMRVPAGASREHL